MPARWSRHAELEDEVGKGEKIRQVCSWLKLQAVAGAAIGFTLCLLGAHHVSSRTPFEASGMSLSSQPTQCQPTREASHAVAVRRRQSAVRLAAGGTVSDWDTV
eukprot:773663-Amphidinium_carterae.1